MENVVQDPVYKCEEKQEENCHTTFVTTFKSHSEEDCAEHFEKKCQISFRQEASVEKIVHCYQ